MFPLFDHRKTLFYLSLSIAAVLISSQITSSDSPYGVILSYMGTVIFVIAFADRWVRSGSYIILTIISTMIIIVSIILNNIPGENYRDIFPEDIREFLFFLAVFLCPFGIVIGIVGYFFLSCKPGKK